MGLVISSKAIQKDDTFICLPGGEYYISEALNRGAKCVLRLSRQEAGCYAAQYYNHPSERLRVVGVTGTNGKTTVTWLVHHAINQLGGCSQLQGTLNSRLTTPESPETLLRISDHLKQGGTHFVMEVSSHAIAQNRIAGVSFSVKCLTNISHDHLDYHGSFKNYAAIKHSFLNHTHSKQCVTSDSIQTISILDCPNIVGEFNQQNLKYAKQILLRLGFLETRVDAVLKLATCPPGRFEILSHSPLVIVDYAHTPDALQSVLKAARKRLPKTGSLLVIIGCGGNRDQQKRPKMGRISAQYADFVVFTQDNSRHEDPKDIIADMYQGVKRHHRKRVTSILDRYHAIETVIKKLNCSDGLVIAGKGHESVQYAGDSVVSFSDRNIAKQMIRKYL